MSSTTTAVDLKAMKAMQHATWSDGNYSMIGTTLQIVGEHLAEAVGCSSGQKVLDVAAGNGNATLAFARRFCDVTSTDYVPELLEHGRARAAAEGARVAFQTEDAEALSFDDNSFDVVVSTFGVMFTADQQAAAAEMMRVCRPGGTIGMANWTPDGFVGRLFKLIGMHLNVPADAPKPPVWGTESWLNQAFAGASRISCSVKQFNLYSRSPEACVEFFRTWYGPVKRAFLSLDEQGRAALEKDYLDLIAEYNTATDGTMRVPHAYLEVVIQK